MRQVLLLFAFVLSTTLSATHLITGDFTFEHQSTSANTSTYKVTLHLYRDLNGINLPSSATVSTRNSANLRQPHWPSPKTAATPIIWRATVGQTMASAS